MSVMSAVHVGTNNCWCWYAIYCLWMILLIKEPLNGKYTFRHNNGYLVSFKCFYSLFVELLLLCYREPDSTYYELPQPGHSGDRVATSSLPSNRAEVCMDVYHMRDMNDNVMVRKKTILQLHCIKQIMEIHVQPITCNLPMHSQLKSLTLSLLQKSKYGAVIFILYLFFIFRL